MVTSLHFLPYRFHFNEQQMPHTGGMEGGYIKFFCSYIKWLQATFCPSYNAQRMPFVDQKVKAANIIHMNIQETPKVFLRVFSKTILLNLLL